MAKLGALAPPWIPVGQCDLRLPREVYATQIIRLTDNGCGAMVVPVIKSFANAETAALWAGESVRRLPADLQRRALVKLQLINAAVELAFLRLPPGNRLEALKGARNGQHSIRINDQWRICFVWTGADAEEVELVDYH
jgi:proteic killer suppression protein